MIQIFVSSNISYDWWKTLKNDSTVEFQQFFWEKKKDVTLIEQKNLFPFNVISNFI